MHGYRRPAGHHPYVPRTGNHTGPLAGLCVLVILASMILLSLLALDRAASARGPHALPAQVMPMDRPAGTLLAMEANR